MLLKGVNDSLAQARHLADFLKNIPAHVNIIPFNPWEGSIYERPSSRHIRDFAVTVQERNRYVSVAVRWPRGDDIGGACGQLKLSLDAAKDAAADAGGESPVQATAADL